MESICIGSDNLNPPMYIVKLDDNNNVISISVNSNVLKGHFQNKLWCYDFHRYIKISDKDLNEIGNSLIENQTDWNILNDLHNKLWELRCNHFNNILDEKGYLKKKYNKYSSIAYKCCPFVERKYKTVDYINQLIGIYANYL